jgi:hypothetical protein
MASKACIKNSRLDSVGLQIVTDFRKICIRDVLTKPPDETTESRPCAYSEKFQREAIELIILHEYANEQMDSNACATLKKNRDHLMGICNHFLYFIEYAVM